MYERAASFLKNYYFPPNNTVIVDVLLTRDQKDNLSVPLSSWCVCFTLRLLRRQVKYKEEGKKEASVSLYSLMPDTLETQRARDLTDMLSEVG